MSGKAFVELGQSERILAALGAWCELEAGRRIVITNRWDGRVGVELAEGCDDSRGFQVVACSGENLRDALAQVAQVVL